MMESGNARLQLIALPSIERHPIPGRVALLERLLNSAEPEAREAAAAVKQLLEGLERKPLPDWKMFQDVARAE